MHAGVMDPNVSAANEAHYNFEDLQPFVSDADIKCIASMLTDEQPMLTDEQPVLTDEQMSIITSLEHSTLTDDDDDDDTVGECTRSHVSKHADSGKDFDVFNYSYVILLIIWVSIFSNFTLIIQTSNMLVCAECYTYVALIHLITPEMAI